MWAGVVPDEHSNEYRLDQIEGNAKEALVAARRLQEASVVQGVQLLAAQDDVRELRDEVKEARAGVRALIMVLVGFAFTVAGGAVLLALTVGGHP
jgi:hypothetical protein